MAMQDVAAAVRRIKDVLERRPSAGLHDDPRATVRWIQGLRMEASNANGKKMLTDMPPEVGGSGDQVTPGWMFRSGIASCTATVIAMTAAEEGIELTLLEVSVSSRSDARGMFGITDESGAMVFAGPGDMQMHVRIGANGATPQMLRDLVAQGVRCSPMFNAVGTATPIAVHVEPQAEAA
jgi:uncharacterized OsmC-like protein